MEADDIQKLKFKVKKINKRQQKLNKTNHQSLWWKLTMSCMITLG